MKLRPSENEEVLRSAGRTGINSVCLDLEGT